MSFKYSVMCLLLLQMNLKSSFARNDAPTKINYREVEHGILKDILNEKYHKTVRPSGANGTGPTVVTVNMYVRNFAVFEDPLKWLAIKVCYDFLLTSSRVASELLAEYTTQLTFRQQWLDERLKYDTNDTGRHYIKYITLLDATKIWTPDIYFANEITAYIHDLMSPNIYFRIFPNGEVLYSIRISLKLTCPQNLVRFPFDQQTCAIIIASNAFTTEDTILKWKQADPAQVSSALVVIQDFEFYQFTTDYCDSQTNTGTYSCLRVDFALRRILQPWIDNVFLPAIMVVMLAWLGCWINESTFSTLRALIGLSSLIILFVEFGSVKSSIRQTGYRKAIDIWMGWCLLFVFSTLIEFIVVTHFSRISRSPATRADSQTNEIPLSGNQLNVEVREQHDSNITRRFYTWFAKLMVSQKIDITFRILYPTSFAVFCLVYFTSYGGSESK